MLGLLGAVFRNRVSEQDAIRQAQRRLAEAYRDGHRPRDWPFNSDRDTTEISDTPAQYGLSKPSEDHHQGVTP